MKTPSNNLFRLIKSFSTQEKRFFKLFMPKNQANTIYFQLFDAYDGLKQYDEKKLLTALKKTGEISNLKETKNYLQEALLNFLEYHHASYSVEIQLQRLLQRIELLFERNLLDMAQKVIQKTEKIAEENHQYLYLLKVLDWKRRRMIGDSDSAGLIAYEKTNYLSELHAIDLHKNMVEYQKINTRLIGFFFNQPENINEKTLSELKGMLKKPLLQNEKTALSFPAKLIYCRILGDIHMCLKNWRKSYSYLKRAVGYFEQAGLTPGDRLTVFIKLTIPLRKLKKNDEFLLVKDAVIKLVQSQPKKLQTIRLYKQLISILNNYIDYQLSLFDLDGALSTSDEILELVENKASAQNFLVFYCNLILIYFFMSDYRKALYCANKVLSKEKTGVRQDIIVRTKFLSLVIHYELGNIDVLPNLCKSYSHYFDQQQLQLNIAENILLNFFSQTIQKKGAGSNRQNRLNLFIALEKELESTNRSADNVFTQFDFMCWVDSKIENRPMIDVLKEKR